MTRVSSPELLRALPAPQASISVTRSPLRRSHRALHPPKAPAPTTTIEAPGVNWHRTSLSRPPRGGENVIGDDKTDTLKSGCATPDAGNYEGADARSSYLGHDHYHRCTLLHLGDGCHGAAWSTIDLGRSHGRLGRAPSRCDGHRHLTRRRAPGNNGER